MRGNGLGVGDVGAVPGGAWFSGHASLDGDGWRTCRQHVGGVLCRCWELERDPALEPCGDGVGVGDGARVEPGGGSLHGDGTRRTHGMRGDGLGVGDVGAVPGGAWCTGHTASDDDCGRSDREHVGRVLCGGSEHERDASWKPCGHGIGVGDGARVESGTGCVDGAGTDGADGMRGDGVGVGDVGAMFVGTGDPGHTAGGDDCRRADQERERHVRTWGA
jgi:hypothetical protein